MLQKSKQYPTDILYLGKVYIGGLYRVNLYSPPFFIYERRCIVNMARIIGLDFETETDERGNARLLMCAMYNEEWQDDFDLRKREDYERFYYTILVGGHKYVVFNASFDIEIIMILLLKNGFKFLTPFDNPTHKSMSLLKGQKIYELTTYFMVGTQLVKSTFMDLANIIVGASLKEVAEKFTSLEKGNYEASKEDWEEFRKYCMLDAQITYEAYNTITKLLGMHTLTIGGAAFTTMLNMSFAAKSKKGKFGLFKALYGKLTVEDDKYLRNWYAGGLGWSSTDERTETRIHSYDIISAYPEASTHSLPTLNRHVKYLGYKEPTEEMPFAFIKLKVTGQVKKNYVPVLPSRNIYGDSNVYIYDDKTVYIIQEYGKKSEYEYWLDSMEIEEIEYLETILMRKATRNVLKPFMEKFLHMKDTTTGIEREFAKRMLNSLTGKLGSNPLKETTIYGLTSEHKLIRTEAFDTEADTYATHVISVITSRVRCKCYEVDEILRDKVDFRMYATDSVKYSSDKGHLIKTGNKWGEWDLEHEDVDFIFLGLKAYIFDANNEKGNREVMCAGISRDYKNKITNEQFYAKTTVKSLISLRTGNGRVIYEGLKRIASPVKKPRRRS